MQNGQTDQEILQGLYGISLTSKAELKELKKKIQLLKDAVNKERKDRQKVEENIKGMNSKCLVLEGQLAKKEEKNELLLHQSRQLKDILIRQKQEIKKLQDEISKMNNREATPNNQTKTGWTSYLSGFWK